MVVIEYAVAEAEALEALAKYFSYVISQTRGILGPNYGDYGMWHDNSDLAIQGYGASQRALQGYEETARLGYSKIVWLSNEKGDLRPFRMTPGPSMVSDQNLYFAGSAVERSFGGIDVQLGQARDLE